MDAERTVQNRIYYTKYWLTMVTGGDPMTDTTAATPRLGGRRRAPRDNEMEGVREEEIERLEEVE